MRDVVKSKFYGDVVNVWFQIVASNQDRESCFPGSLHGWSFLDFLDFYVLKSAVDFRLRISFLFKANNSNDLEVIEKNKW